MFLKAADKKDKNTGKVYRYYKLCESYRFGSKTRHRCVFVLGKLDEIATDSDKKTLADRIEYYLCGNHELYPVEIPDFIDKMARQYSSQIKARGFTANNGTMTDVIPTKSREKDFQQVDLSSFELENTREIGSEWLCKQAVEQLGIEKFLSDLGWSKFQVDTALIHLISRAVFPASEHKTAQWIQENSSVAELFDRLPEDIDRFQLYRASQMLYKEKSLIEKHLSVKTSELFDLQDKIILYDLTNTYFEGRKAKSTVARFGRSKEKRSDAKIVALALVVNIEGFVKHSHIYRGNIADCKTLGETIDSLSESTSSTGRKPVVVIDAGIGTDENLSMLKTKQYSYVSVSRTKLKNYSISETGTVQIEDNRKHSIDISWAENVSSDDRFLYVHSEMKAIKETSMENRYCDRYEEELDNIARAIHKKGGTKRYGKVMERIGRIKERYPAANKYYEIEIAEKDGIAVSVTWKRKPAPTPSGEGTYFIRTNIEQTDEKLVWDIYNTIRQIEGVFRVLKTDLSLRPVFHKSDELTMAHLFLGVLAYSIVNTIRYTLKQLGINHEWRNVVRIMNSQKAGTIVMDQKDGKKVHLRLCSRPINRAKEIYEALNYKPMPFYRKKFVFPE
ncbi:MAG: IS1634 family transposase [Bacteroidetes bacterium]|nr:IS1634 family transposase [Bacteroidota bacterium]MBU1721122.1 IS1634 family transposase [Bacteroidota bacterium]MBU1901508.1 IS1634 family transposase [Patescibacteria group bacterium]